MYSFKDFKSSVLNEILFSVYCLIACLCSSKALAIAALMSFADLVYLNISY